MDEGCEDGVGANELPCLFSGCCCAGWEEVLGPVMSVKCESVGPAPPPITALSLSLSFPVVDGLCPFF